MKTEEIVCDQCGGDLSTTTNCVGYRLSLQAERIPPAGPTVTLMHIEPPLKHHAHFCGLKCLWAWAADQHERNPR